jgi:hypothetical protein
MTLRNKSPLGSLGCAVLCGLMIMVMTTSTAMAQQNTSNDTVAPANGKAEPPTSAARKSDTISLEEMLALLKRLEERVKELETALSKTNGKNSESEEAIQAVQQEISTLKEEKAEDDKKNSGFVSFFRRTEISGFVDAYYGYNFNRPSGDTQVRNFDTKHNQFGFNLAEITLEKKPTEESRLGVRLDLNFGPATEIVHSAEPGGSDIFRNIQQGYLSYLAPVGKGLEVDVGKFVTPHGAEVIETKDNWNYSRSLLFTLAIPYYHFGVRATMPFSDTFALSGFVVNGWNNVVDNNRRKTYGVQAVVKPTSKLTIIQNYMGGPEQPGNNDDWRHLWDTTLIYTVTPSLSVMANYDYGVDRVAGARVHWQGIAAYAHYQVNNRVSLAPRFEWYDDHDGFTTGLRQTLKEFTITSEHKINGGLLTRFEYRRDFSNEPFFNKPVDRLVKGQSTLAFGVVYVFSSKGEQ